MPKENVIELAREVVKMISVDRSLQSISNCGRVISMKYNEDGFSKEKTEWMEEVGIREFDKPMKFYTPYGGLYSEEYIKNTSLEELKKRYEGTIPVEPIQKG